AGRFRAAVDEFGERAFVAFGGGDLRLYDLNRGSEIARLPSKSTSTVAPLAGFSPDGACLFTSSGGDSPVLWNARDGTRAAAIAPEKLTQSSGLIAVDFAFTRDGRGLATTWGSGSGWICWNDCATGRLLYRENRASTIRPMTSATHHELFAWNAWGGGLETWCGGLLSRHESHAADPSSMSVSPDGKMVRLTLSRGAPSLLLGDLSHGTI